MPIFRWKSGKKTIYLRISSQILIFLAVAGLSALALQPLGRFFQNKTAQIRENLLTQAESVIGRRLAYASIRPSLAGAFDIRGVRILDEAGEPVASIGRLRVTYSLWKLVRKNKQAISSILIDRPHINFDTSKDWDIIERLTERSGGKTSSKEALQEMLAAYLPQKAVLRIRGGSAAITIDGNQCRLSGLHFDARSVKKQLLLNVRCNADLSLAGLGSQPFNTRLNVSVNGSYSAESGEGNATIKFPYIMGDAFKLNPLEFSFTVSKGGFWFKNARGRYPVELSFLRDWETGYFFAGLKCDGFIPGKLLSAQKGKKRGSWLAMLCSGRAEFNYDARGMRYSANLAGKAPLADGGNSFLLVASGDETKVVINEFYLNAPRIYDSGPFAGSVDFKGSVGLHPIAPNGVMAINDFSLTGDGNLNAELVIGTWGSKVSVFCDTLEIGDVSFTDFEAVITPLDKGVEYSMSALTSRNTESHDEVSMSSLSMDGALDYEPIQNSASLRVNSFAVNDLTGMIRPFVKNSLPQALTRMGKDLFVTTEIFLETNFAHFLYNAPRFIIATESGEPSIISEPIKGKGGTVGLISVSGTNQHIEISEGRFIRNGSLLQVSGSANYANPMDISFSVTANYRDFSYYLEGVALDLKSITINGSYGISLFLGSGSGDSFSGYMQAQDVPIPYQDKTGRLSFFSSIRFNSFDSWVFDLEHFELLDIAIPSGTANFRVSGGANQDGMAISQIRLDDGKGTLMGRADFSWTKGFLNKENIATRTFSGTFALSGGEEYYHLTAFYAQELLDVAFSGSGMQLGRVLTNIGNSVADCGLHVSWNMAQALEDNPFQAELKINSFTGRWNDSDFKVSAQAALHGGIFTAKDVQFNFAALKGAVPQLSIDLAAGNAQAEACLNGYAAGNFIDGLFSANAAFAPVKSWLDVESIANAISGVVQVKKLKYAKLEEADPFDFEFSRSSGALSVWGGPRKMFRLEADHNGDFFASLSAPSPVRGSVIGKINSNAIDAHCSNLYIDLAGVWALLPPIPDFAFSGGYANAWLDIRGPLADPDFFGALQGNSVRIRSPNFVTQEIRSIPFTAVIDGNELRFDRVPATVGSGSAIISGWFRFEHWLPYIFQLNIFVPQDSPIPFGFDLGGFLASGDASGNITIAVEGMDTTVKGELYANNTETWLNQDEMTANEDVDMFDMGSYSANVDIKVRVGPSVDFLWPNKKFPILRVNPENNTLVKVLFDTQSRQFSIDSDVKFRSGEIFYFDRSFYIRSGSLVFSEDEVEINPRLSVRAEARDRNDDGPVTIYLIVDNAPLFSFTARFESTPALSQVEIFSLLGQNLTGTRAQIGENSIPFISSTTDILTQTFFRGLGLERGLRKWLNLDMFSIRTQFVQNAVFSLSGLNRWISPKPVDRIGSVGNYLDNTTVFIGKYIGADMFAQSMLTLRYDENRTTFGGLRFEWDIGVEMQTPLFNIRWDFIPTHPENWWVSDNSITLTWRKTF